MRDPAFRSACSTADARSATGRGGRLIDGFDAHVRARRPARLRARPADRASPRRAEREGRDAVDLAYDLLLADDGRAFLYLPFLNYADGNLDAVGEMLAHPNTVPGLGDGGAHVGTICDASFPTTLLALWGRDRDHGRLAAAVPRAPAHAATPPARSGCSTAACSRPATAPTSTSSTSTRLAARRPEMRHDLPAGGKRLVQPADGYVATIVAGQVTYEHGEATGRAARPPRPRRRSPHPPQERSR